MPASNVEPERGNPDMNWYPAIVSLFLIDWLRAAKVQKDCLPPAQFALGH